MKALAFGAVFGLLWVVFGLPLDALSSAEVILDEGDVSTAYVAFLLGLAARPHLTGRWAQ